MTLLDSSVENFTIRLMLEKGVREQAGRQKMIEIHGPADLTAETTDAIVNAASSSLLGGGGVDGAIHRAGGPAILAECRQIVGRIGTLPAGKAVITTGGQLAAKHVVHTVGPIYRGGQHGEAETLASCHRESLRLADEQGLSSLSFPAISTGAYGYPVSEAAPIAISSTLEALSAAKHVTLCRFVLFDLSTVRAYHRAAEQVHRLNATSSFRIEKVHS
ncbi:MAG: O-acetyl-ADP-ribose deacetylase [Candidatus Acidiferrales bacterium]